MSWIYPPRFDMNQQKSKSIGDCYSHDTYNGCLTPLPEDGSPYEVYERNGDLRKDLPLVYRPPYGQAFPRAQGQFGSIHDKYYPSYTPSCKGNMLLLDGRGPCITQEDCQNMQGQTCKYPEGHTNKDSCFVSQCSKGSAKYRCPEGIAKPGTMIENF